MMSARAAAVELFGDEAVELALGEPDPEAVTGALVAEIGQRADPPGAFRAWALAQPWERFCAIVRVVAGETRKGLLDGNPA
jgi:hypothetical protein